VGSRHFFGGSEIVNIVRELAVGRREPFGQKSRVGNGAMEMGLKGRGERVGSESRGRGALRP
jgi:hypothetical protein